MTERLKVGQIDAARRQLETAIDLYFNGAESVSIHTLSAAAYQILCDLGRKKNTSMLVERGISLLPKELAAEAEKLIRKPQNFFKHANRDCGQFIDFWPGLTELLIADAIAKYEELTSERPLIFGAYQLWFTARHPEYFAGSPGANLAKSAHENYAALSRIEFLRQYMEANLPSAGEGQG